MTTHTDPARTAPGATRSSAPPYEEPARDLPSRRLMVILGSVYTLLFAGLMATGGESPAPDTAGSKIIADYDIGDVQIQLAVYSMVVASALLVFYGGALRTVLRSRQRTWTSDVAFGGLILMAVALVGFAVTALAVHHAVETGDASVVQALNVLDNANFPPAMLGLVTTMVATGVTALRTGLLARWLAIASIVIGCLAPLGPAGFIPFALFPIWLIVVAALLRRPDVQPPATA